MAKSSSTQRMLAVILIVIGVGLILWGYNDSGSIGSQLTAAVSGSDDNVMIKYIAGAVSAVIGVFLLIKK